MIKYIFLALSFLFVKPVFSQEVTILKGKISADSLDGSSINIINLTKDICTTNLPSGEFEIKVSEMDTLIFSSLQYQTLEMVITPEVLQESFLNVELIGKLNELDEVIISNIDLTGSLNRDLSQIKTYNQADFGFPLKKSLTPLERQMHRAKSTAISWAFNTLNGTMDKLEKYEKIEKLKAIVQEGMEAVPRLFFIEDLGIPEEHVVNFVYYCAENPNFYILLRPEKRFDLIEYYQMKAPKYLKHKKEN
ncbi:hypothetical protein V5739_09720 [Salinimicrobium sp. TIG7-5_MAKvit]|uniref:hypothetical protein n=1 Tax=Salinimicrobium sp. TIG7-5_MAKvit TaxID=3121289 RepID=UPI003C6DF632